MPTRDRQWDGSTLEIIITAGNMNNVCAARVDSSGRFRGNRGCECRQGHHSDKLRAQIAESNSKANIPTNGIGRKRQKYGLVSL